MCAISSLTSTFAISSPDEFLSGGVIGGRRYRAGGCDVLAPVGHRCALARPN